MGYEVEKNSSYRYCLGVMTLIIHAASIQAEEKSVYLFLCQEGDDFFRWYQVSPLFTEETATSCRAESLTLVIRRAYKQWKEQAFRLLHCGFRYSLPGRDLVGSNALFWQMAKSYDSFNGQYFDPEVGHLCIVDFASHEALEVWRKLGATKARSL